MLAFPDSMQNQGACLLQVHVLCHVHMKACMV